MSLPDDAPDSAFERHAITIGDGGAEASWGIAVESPVEIAINGVPWTVMLATPSDLADLAIGLAVTEHVLADATAVQEVRLSRFLHDISLDLVVDESHLDRSALRARSLPGGTACGLCGLESLAALHAHPKSGVSARTADSLPSSDSALFRAFRELPDHQPINAATRSVHAAAWCAPDGAILLAREDVGRHNALDKLVGAMAQARLLTSPGFIVMTSRCSYELVHKASVTGAQLLATVSAPTSMALQWAAALDLSLACRAGDQIVRFHREAARAT